MKQELSECFANYYQVKIVIFKQNVTPKVREISHVVRLWNRISPQYYK